MTRERVISLRFLFLVLLLSQHGEQLYLPPPLHFLQFLHHLPNQYLQVIPRWFGPLPTSSLNRAITATIHPLMKTTRNVQPQAFPTIPFYKKTRLNQVPQTLILPYPFHKAVQPQLLTKPVEENHFDYSFNNVMKNEIQVLDSGGANIKLGSDILTQDEFIGDQFSLSSKIPFPEYSQRLQLTKDNVLSSSEISQNVIDIMDVANDFPIVELVYSGTDSTGEEHDNLAVVEDSPELEKSNFANVIDSTDSFWDLPTFRIEYDGGPEDTDILDNVEDFDEFYDDGSEVDASLLPISVLRLESEGSTGENTGLQIEEYSQDSGFTEIAATDAADALATTIGTNEEDDREKNEPTGAEATPIETDSIATMATLEDNVNPTVNSKFELSSEDGVGWELMPENLDLFVNGAAQTENENTDIEATSPFALEGSHWIEWKWAESLP